jgi:hypothetical protein
MLCKECGRDFKSFKSLGLHIVQSHWELGIGKRVAVETYFKEHMMVPGEDKCRDCGKDLNFYGLVDRFKGGQCYNCRQKSATISRNNKEGAREKLSEQARERNRTDPSFGWGNLSKTKIEEMKVKRNATKTELRKNPEYWNKTVGALIRGGNKGHGGWHVSPKVVGKVSYDSSWELSAFKSLDADERVLSYERKLFPISYVCEGVTKSYYPDILITYVDGSKELVEIKPDRKLTDITVQLKLLAAAKWSLNNNIPFSVWTEYSWPYENDFYNPE